MFANVLVGIDEGQGGRDALALAHQLAAPGARVLVEPGEIHSRALELEPDLIVLGAARPGPLGRLGDRARTTVVDAPCATAVAPPGYALAPPCLERFGVGYDGTWESERALIAARRLAARHQATIEALWVVTLKAVKDEDPLPPHWANAASELVAHRAKAMYALPDVDGHAVYGSARDELTRLSAEVDLLVVGSHGYGPLKRFLHGTVSGYLATHARCPVVVIPPAAVVGKLYRHAGTPTHRLAISGD